MQIDESDLYDKHGVSMAKKAGGEGKLAACQDWQPLA